MGRLVQPEDSVVAELEARVKQRAAAEVRLVLRCACCTSISC